ncbi:MAG: hypothetical protein ACT4P4_19525 [Betaproteobacteria bacterium]
MGVSFEVAKDHAEVLLASMDSAARQRGLRATLLLANRAAKSWPSLSPCEAFAMEASRRELGRTASQAFAFLTLHYIEEGAETEALRAAYWMEICAGLHELGKVGSVAVQSANLAALLIQRKLGQQRGLASRHDAHRTTREFALALFESKAWKSKADFLRQKEPALREHAADHGWKPTNRFAATVLGWLPKRKGAVGQVVVDSPAGRPATPPAGAIRGRRRR